MDLKGSLELLGAVLAVQSTKLHGYRYLRRFVFPITAGVILLYRAMTNSEDSSTLLSEMVKFVSASSEHMTAKLSGLFGIRVLPLQRLLHDALGLCICSSALNVVLHPFPSGGKGNKGLLQMTKKDFIDHLYQLASELPFVGAAIRKEIDKEAHKLEAELETELKVPSRAIGKRQSALPEIATPASEILQLMKVQSAKENVIWQTGHVSGAVYHGIAEHQDLLNQAFGLYSIANPLHPDIWPSGMKFESEIISMTASLVSGGVDAVCGCTTSGGTESIILAIKAHRDFYRQRHKITRPEIVCCTSAHAAVDKACDLMNINLIKVPMNSSYKIDVERVRAAIGPNTIMIYSSAPSYPQGTIDEIDKLSELAKWYSVGLHVDCCLGGFVLPFMTKLGYKVPVFDFSLEGVTSMSLDTHKYGFALKGASVVLYRTKELRQAQYFCYSEWTGGMYTTPTIAGSRSGGLIAQCWASLMAMGQEGYMKHTKEIVEATRRIANGVRSIQGLQLYGDAEVMIVCFGARKVADGSSAINVYSVAEYMGKKGWSLNSLQNPPCVHICITVRHIGHEQSFLQDLNEAVNSVLESSSKGGAKLEGKAAIYGMASSLPSGPVDSLLKAYNDVVLKL